MFSLFLFGAALASANPVTQSMDPQLDRCLTTAQGITPVNRCYQDALNRVERGILQRLRELPPRLRESKVSSTLLPGGEAAWKSYREKWCTFEEAAERDPDAKTTTGLQCRVEISQDHLARLQHPF